MKLRLADTVFSKWIKKRDKYTCQRCGAVHQEKSQGLHCAHFIGRRNEATRFDPENADALDYGCHSYFHQNPDKHKEWKQKQLGDERFLILTTIRKRTIVKKDDKAVVAHYRGLLANKLERGEV
jgi:5-methylcytosine-specific restriction endonuclease McrA